MRLEQPMPETNAISCGGRPMAARARMRAVTTPKSPQPGHQMGLRSLLKSPGWNFSGETVEVETGLAAGSRRVDMVDVLFGKVLCALVNNRFGLKLMAALDGDDHLAQLFEDFGGQNGIGA